ncbi:unnamed protein product [Rodentolepis nana]|uniref:Uncharacterized protein n=1 Tax=Rodentolepis nana TaxID=102285 RepID=A0A0R3TZ76_RODNA|nr:unnamed protein product [Rodentolepis nana]
MAETGLRSREHSRRLSLDPCHREERTLQPPYSRPESSSYLFILMNMYVFNSNSMDKKTTFTLNGNLAISLKFPKPISLKKSNKAVSTINRPVEKEKDEANTRIHLGGVENLNNLFNLDLIKLLFRKRRSLSLTRNRHLFLVCGSHFYFDRIRLDQNPSQYGQAFTPLRSSIIDK